MPRTVHRGHCLWLAAADSGTHTSSSTRVGYLATGSPQEGRGRGPCSAKLTAALGPGHTRAPLLVACACAPRLARGHAWPCLCLCQNEAKGPPPEPGGKCPRCGDTSPMHTGPILSHSHWIDSAIQSKTTDRERRAGPPAAAPGTHARGRGGLPQVAHRGVCRTGRAQTQEQSELEGRPPRWLSFTDLCEASLLGHGPHWRGEQSGGTKTDKSRWPARHVAAGLPWELSGMLSRGGDQSWAKEMLDIERRSHFLPTTTAQASEGLERPSPTTATHARSQRERHLNVEQGGSPGPAPWAEPILPSLTMGRGPRRRVLGCPWLSQSQPSSASSPVGRS